MTLYLLWIDLHNDGDAADDGVPGNHAGRSGFFGYHAFATLNGNIYDASGGCVDVDLDPDDGPIHFPYRYLDGDDTWTSDYDGRVIDPDPNDYGSPSSPGNHTFGVE